MECFRDTIGIRYCTPVTPAFGIYINQLPGISLRSLDGIANEDQQDFLGVWDDVQQRAIINLESRLLNHFTSYFRSNLNYQNSRFGVYPEPQVLDAQENRFKGVYLFGSLYRYLKLQLRSFRFYSQSNVTNAQFFIADTISGEILKTITTTLSEGFNDVEIGFDQYNRFYNYERLFLYYNDSDFQSIQCDSNFINGDYGLPCDPIFSALEKFYATGAYVPNSSTPTESTIIKGSNTFGISLQFNVNCSLDAYICTIKDRFKSPWLNLLGAELMNERMNSERLNKYTLRMSEEEMEDRYEKYLSDFEESLKAVLDNIQLPDDICFDCNTQTYSTFLKP